MTSSITNQLQPNSHLHATHNIVGNVSNFNRKSERTLSSEAELVQYLKECEASTSKNGNSLVINIGNGNVPTSTSFLNMGQKVEIKLNHPSFNYGIKVDEQVTINLGGHHTTIPISFFQEGTICRFQ